MDVLENVFHLVLNQPLVRFDCVVMVAVDFWSCELCKSTERQNIQAMRILNEIVAIKSLSVALFLETTSQPTPSSLAIYVWKNRSQNARLWMCHRRRRRHGKIREVPWCQLTSHNSMAIINCFDSLRSPIWIHLSNCTQRHLIALRLFTSIRFLRIFNIFFLSFSIIFFHIIFFLLHFFSQLENSDFHTFPDTLPIWFIVTQLASALGRRVRILTNFNRQFETIGSLKIARTNFNRSLFSHTLTSPGRGLKFNMNRSMRRIEFTLLFFKTLKRRWSLKHLYKSEHLYKCWISLATCW